MANESQSLPSPTEETSLLPTNVIGQGPESPVIIPHLIKSRLYTSHTLSTFNDRVFEFASILFIVDIFPNTLFPSSLYAIIRSVVAIFLAPSMGRYVDKNKRLRVVRNMIGERICVSEITSSFGLLVIQRMAVLVSSIVFLSLMTVFKDGSSVLKWSALLVTIALASIERLCAIANTVAIERDWVVVIADGNRAQLEGVFLFGWKIFMPAHKSSSQLSDAPYRSTLQAHRSSLRFPPRGS